VLQTLLLRLCSILVLVFGAKSAPNGTMSRISMMPKRPDDRARQNLRLDPKLWAAIDSARRTRPGNISRNTWITEAILEKVARDDAERAMSGSGDGRRA
jgi:hypothetical protein